MENYKNPEVHFCKNVLLVDVALFNLDAANMRRAMSWGLKRELPLIDMLQWIPCIALDGHAPAYGQETQIIFVHESPETQLTIAAQPDFLKSDGLSFFVPEVNEFQISCVHPAGFTDTPSLFFDLMHILLDSSDVTNLMLAPSHELYGQSVEEELDKVIQEHGVAAVEKVCYFSVFHPEKKQPYRQCVSTMSFAHVLGITPDDVGA